MRNSELNGALAAAITVSCLIAGLAPANAQNTAEDRLRAQLRQATVQLRSLQDQNASLQVMQAQADRERMELAAKLAGNEKEIESLRVQLRGSQSASQAANDRLKVQQDAYLKVDAQNRENFARLQAAYNETVQALRIRDADVSRFSTTLAQTRGRVQACESQNFELYKLGNEVLNIYDHQNILQAIGGAEPFTKLMRVQYENLLQQYGDKLRANEIVHPIR